MIQPVGSSHEIRFGPLGILTDLHGNPAATEAVLADGKALGVSQWLVLGDVVAMGPDPAAVLHLLDELEVVVSISGNTERYVLTGDRPDPTLAEVSADPALLPRLVEVAASFGWTKGFLSGAGLLDKLDTYVGACEVALPDGTTMLAVHASLVSDQGAGITPEIEDDSLAELFAASTADLVIGGHTHRWTDRTIGGRRYLNPGSVSNPVGEDKSARYMVLHCSESGYEVDHRSVVYDIEAVRKEIMASGYPGADYLLTAYFNQ